MRVMLCLVSENCFVVVHEQSATVTVYVLIDLMLKMCFGCLCVSHTDNNDGDIVSVFVIVLRYFLLLLLFFSVLENSNLRFGSRFLESHRYMIQISTLVGFESRIFDYEIRFTSMLHACHPMYYITASTITTTTDPVQTHEASCNNASLARATSALKCYLHNTTTSQSENKSAFAH